MSLNLPSSNTVFTKWLYDTPEKQVKKHFEIKGEEFQVSDVTVDKYVKNVISSAGFIFTANISSKTTKSSGKSKKITVDEKKFLKTKFFVFTHPAVDPAYWKGPKEVANYNSITPVSCEKCASGAVKCKNCKGSGHSDCQKCKASGKLKCKRCGGSGQVDNKLEILERGLTAEEKKKEKYITNCPVCHGDGGATCPSCNGFGRNACKKCKGLGKATCKKCKGTGNFYQYELIPVPFGKSSAQGKREYHVFYEPTVEKVVLNEIEKKFNLIQGVELANVDDLKENFVSQYIGMSDSDIKGRIKRCKQMFEKLESKDDSKTPQYPILLVPVVQLDILTPNNKKFNIVSLGTDSNFAVFAPGF